MNGAAGGEASQPVGSPALLSARALKPRLGISRPAPVKSPAFIMSRLLKRAAIISRLLLAAFSISLSLDRFLFEMLGIAFLLKGVNRGVNRPSRGRQAKGRPNPSIGWYLFYFRL
jgi:hypothetical protein